MTIILTKSVTADMAMRFDAIADSWEHVDGLDIDDGQRYNELADKLSAHAKTSCRQPITLTGWECQEVAEELTNAADVYNDNKEYPARVKQYTTLAAQLEALAN